MRSSSMGSKRLTNLVMGKVSDWKICRFSTCHREQREAPAERSRTIPLSLGTLLTWTVFSIPAMTTTSPEKN
jgi:hypothetical protein